MTAIYRSLWKEEFIHGVYPDRFLTVWANYVFTIVIIIPPALGVVKDVRAKSMFDVCLNWMEI